MWRSMKTVDPKSPSRRTGAFWLASLVGVLLAASVAAQDVSIEKSTNGQDADAAPGPVIVAGDPVNWTYLISAGIRDLQNVVVTDDQGVAVSCPDTNLGAGLSMTCTASGTATTGQYANLGTVAAEFVVNGQPVSPDTDPSHYFGVAELALSIEKSTEGADADVAPGPTLPVGGSVSWSYLVTNEGTVDTLTNVVVTDDQGVAVSCPQTELVPSESMTCTGSGTVQAGQYANIGQAAAELPGAVVVIANDPSHYFGQSMVFQKSTNGQDADSPPGPSIPLGDPVNWSYLVGNPGPETISNIVVSDDQGVAVSCPETSLLASESMICTGSGTAVGGPYANIGTAAGDLASGPTIIRTDPSHYTGILPNAVSIEKSTNGEDADLPPGPVVATGAPVAWTYVVSNFGAANLSSIVVTDDQGVTVSCPPGDLLPGQSKTCTANGTAIAGPYENEGTVDAILDGTGPVTDSDLSHYFGQDQDIDYGDAPDPTFPTLFASQGASHVLSPTVFLGACVDSEINGQPTPGADGDDLGAGSVTNGTCAVADNDEDGVTFLDPLVSGALVNIEVVANAACVLTAWIDFNIDGDWDEPTDALFPGGAALVPGINALSFTVPANAFGGDTYARFRCTTDTPPEGGVFGFLGQADDGEVEDYLVQVELDLEATLVDSVAGGAAVPGSLINYQATVTSVAGSATAVDFDLTLDPNTLPSGVVTTTPLARDDGLYEVDPSVPTTIDGSPQPRLLANDFGIPAPTAIAAAAQPTTLGGTVDISTDGSFTYTPFGGATGGEIDTFTYDVENGIPSGSPATDTATASLILGGSPIASDDDADNAPAYFVTAGSTLTVLDGPTDPVERNDFIGSPAGALSHFGGADLGGLVTDNLAGATVTPLPAFADGSLTVNADGSFTFVTPTGLTGSWQFDYRLTNTLGTSDARVTIQVQVPPDAIDDGPAGGAVPGDPFATLPGVAIDTTAHATPSVLDNDILGVPAGAVTFYGPSGSPTTPAEGGPAPTDGGGTIEVSTNGEFVYTPLGGFTGTDAFEYILGNPAGNDTATVEILVAGPPIAQDDALTVVQNTSTPLDAAADNGSGADDFGNPAGSVDFYGPVGGPLTTTPVNPFALPSGNTVNFTGGAGVGTFTYDATVNPTFSGVESFDYQITNVAGSDIATVTMTVEAPPTAVDDFPDMLSAPGDAYHTALNTPLDSSSHTTPPVLTNDDLGFPVAALVSYGTSSDATVQTTLGATTPTDNGGTVSMTVDGNFVYTPPSATFTGPDLFAYRIENAAGFDDGVVTIAVGLRPVCDDETDPDDYDALGNVGINVPAASGVLIGDTGDEITVSGNTAPAGPPVGTATVAPDGGFTYTSGPGFSGTDTFTYTVGNGFGDSAPCTVEVTVANTIWFIDNGAGGSGNGTQTAPFDELSDMVAAADGSGDIIFLDEGDGFGTDYDDGITLKDSQLFIGQGVDLTTAAGITLPPFSNALPIAAGRPEMTNISGAGIVLANGNLVTGLDVVGAVGTGIAGTNTAVATIDDVGLSNNGSNGATFSNATGTIDIDNLDVSGTSTIGVNISGGSASYDFDSSSSIVSPTGTAFRINGGTASVVYSGSITQANNATTVDIGSHSGGTVTFQTGTITATNGNGLQFSNADGTYNFNGQVTLSGSGDEGIDILGGSAGTFTFANTDITSPSGTAVRIDGSTAGVTFQAASSVTQANNASAVSISGHSTGTVAFDAGSSINASNGNGLQFSNADASYNFNGSVTLNGGGDAGIDILAGSAGTFTFANTTITTPTNGAFNIDASSATVNYNAGSIVQNSAATAYRANGNNGGIQNIAVAITANTSTATGISLTSNGGATINLTGALDIDTTTGGGFLATGGGTVANDSTETNTVATTTGSGVNVSDTIIGGGGLTFRSVDVNGGGTTNPGIILDDTGTGAFSVTGTGTTDGSGGTIQDIQQDGVRLFDTDGLVSLFNMTIEDIGDMGAAAPGHHGIDGQQVDGGLTLNNVTIQRVTDSAIHGETGGGGSTTWSGLSIINSTLANSNRFHLAGQADGGGTDEAMVTVEGISGTVAITGNDFDDGPGFVNLFTASSGSVDITVQSNTFDDGRKDLAGVPSVGSSAVRVNNVGSITSAIRIGDPLEATPALGNTFTDSGSDASIFIGGFSATDSANVDLVISQNNVTVLDHTSPPGLCTTPATCAFDFPNGGIGVESRGSGTFEGIISQNTLVETQNSGGLSTGSLRVDVSGDDTEVIVRNNTLTRSWDGTLFIRADDADGNGARGFVLVDNNTYTSGLIGIPGSGDDLDAIGFPNSPSPFLPSRFQVRNGATLDLTIDDDDMVSHDTGTNPQFDSFDMRINGDAVGGTSSTFNVLISNSEGPEGFRLRNDDSGADATDSEFNLSRGLSADAAATDINAAQAQSVLDDNANTTGGGATSADVPFNGVNIVTTTPTLPVVTPP